MKKPSWKLWIKSKKECQTWYKKYLRKGMLKKRKKLKPKDHMKKATHNLDFGNWIYEKHKDEIKSVFGKERFFDWVLVIYYYAVYHAALALVASEGFESKSHMATLNLIILKFYHEKKLEKEDVEVIAEKIPRPLEKEDIEVITESKKLRERASYGASYDFEKSLVKNSKKDVIKFIQKVKTILDIE